MNNDEKNWPMGLPFRKTNQTFPPQIITDQEKAVLQAVLTWASQAFGEYAAPPQPDSATGRLRIAIENLKEARRNIIAQVTEELRNGEDGEEFDLAKELENIGENMFNIIDSGVSEQVGAQVDSYPMASAHYIRAVGAVTMGVADLQLAAHLVRRKE